MIAERFGDSRAEIIAVHGQRPAGRHLMLIGAGENQRTGAAHFLVQQAHGIELPVVRPKRVGADQFGQAIGLVGIGGDRLTVALTAAHFMQDDRDTGRNELPAGFGTGETATDNVNRRGKSCHGVAL